MNQEYCEEVLRQLMAKHEKNFHWSEGPDLVEAISDGIMAGIEIANKIADKVAKNA